MEGKGGMLISIGALRPKGKDSEEREQEDGGYDADRTQLAKDFLDAIKSGDPEAVISAFDAMALSCDECASCEEESDSEE